VGWASGIERIILELKDQLVAVPGLGELCAYLVYQGDAGKRVAFRLAERLREQGVAADVSSGDRKLGKQLSGASRSGARYALIVGDDELATNTVTIKDLRDGGGQERVAQEQVVAHLRGQRGIAE
jgi:histidyl-tRNA synthetase